MTNNTTVVAILFLVLCFNAFIIYDPSNSYDEKYQKQFVWTDVNKPYKPEVKKLIAETFADSIDFFIEYRLCHPLAGCDTLWRVCGVFPGSENYYVCAEDESLQPAFYSARGRYILHPPQIIK